MTMQIITIKVFADSKAYILLCGDFNVVCVQYCAWFQI